MITARKSPVTRIRHLTKKGEREPDPNTRHGRLRLAREEREARGDDGFRGKDVAAKLGMAASHLSAYETGSRRLSDVDLIERWADVVGVRMEWVNTGKGQKWITETGSPMEQIRSDVAQYLTEVARNDEANQTFLELLRARITSNFRTHFSRWVKDDKKLTETVENAVYIEIGPPNPQKSDVSKGRANGKD